MLTVAATAPEDIKIAGMGIAPQRLLYLQSEAVHAPAHVRAVKTRPTLTPREIEGCHWQHSQICNLGGVAIGRVTRPPQLQSFKARSMH